MDNFCNFRPNFKIFQIPFSIMVKSILIAGLGGFIGTVLRFLISRYFQLSYASSFPWGTLLINLAGCFLVGIFFGISEKGNFMSSEWRLFLTVGFCGGFTSFSTFSNESFMLLQNYEILRFVLYTGLSLIFGLSFVFLGRLIIKII